MEAKGSVNVYVCRTYACQHRTFSVHLNTGVTPFVYRCAKCGGEATSQCMRLGVLPMRLVIELVWYRPTAEAFKALDEPSKDHVLNGGLMPQWVGQAYAPMADDTKPDCGYDDFQTWCQAVYGERQQHPDYLESVRKVLDRRQQVADQKAATGSTVDTSLEETKKLNQLLEAREELMKLRTTQPGTQQSTRYSPPDKNQPADPKADQPT